MPLINWALYVTDVKTHSQAVHTIDCVSLAHILNIGGLLKSATLLPSCIIETLCGNYSGPKMFDYVRDLHGLCRFTSIKHDFLHRYFQEKCQASW